MLGKQIIIIQERIYRISDDLTKLKKAQAYIIETLGDPIVLPYLGRYDEALMSKTVSELEPGIYKRRKGTYPKFIFPTKKQRPLYAIDKIQDLSDRSALDSSEYKKTDIDWSVDGDIFIPPRHIDDDPMNQIIKAAIAAKRINFDAYGPRWSEMDVGTDPASRKTNVKKALLKNTTMTATKASQYCPILDLKYAIVVANTANSAHPMMFSPIAFFSDEPFDLSKVINLNDVADTIFDPKGVKNGERDDDSED